MFAFLSDIAGSFYNGIFQTKDRDGSLSQTRLKVITLAIMLSLFLASVEGTIVATAMPTIVSQLGGLSIYSWVFAVYMLTSTTTVPIYGKLSDLYGRKPVYVVSMGLFLVGSVLCGLAGSMETLILFRGLPPSLRCTALERVSRLTVEGTVGNDGSIDASYVTRPGLGRQSGATGR